MSDIGISVIICCYNSASRIERTLAALALQEVPPTIPWELILVNNASTDNTVDLAVEKWKEYACKIPFRIVDEPQSGLTYAREKGISEAAYEILVFCDDDNWLEPNYVAGIYKILTSNEQIAACGGEGVPFFEGNEPTWFNTYQEAFATGKQDRFTENGQIIQLYGAGLGIKKSSLDELAKKGFKPKLNGRTGKNLASGEDTELSYALILIGKKLIFSPELKFHHYLPVERTSLQYLNKLFIAFGQDGPIRNIYYSNITQKSIHQSISNWYIHFALSLARMAKYIIVPPKLSGRQLYFNWSRSYITELFNLKATYPEILRDIRKLKQENLISNR